MHRVATFRRLGLGLVALASGLASACLAPAVAAAQSLPEIRSSERNRVPACVTPARLMRFLEAGNSRLLPKFQDIAEHYKRHGEANRVRWDYAFFQMILETNYLKFKNAAGQGDVDPRQNNFAGIGTTGGGVPGDSFPDVSTGVLAQMQHLIAYSGERVDNPVGRRTREKQDEIIQRSKMLGRTVTFRDLTRRWAVDARYASSIATVAGRFQSQFCNGREEPDEEATVAEADERRLRRRGKGGGRMRGVERETPPETRPGEGEEIETAERPSGSDLARQAMQGDSAEERRGIRAGLGIEPPPAEFALRVAPRPASRPTGCRVFTASYGGEKNLLIRVIVEREYHYTALQVIDGQEDRLARAFIATHAKGGEKIEEFPSRGAALDRAFELCPAAGDRAG